jgi:histidyl-tRNA synthetase
MCAKASKIRVVKGMVDIMPETAKLWHEVEATAERIFGTYGYGEIRTPIVERLELFRRGVGENTSVVQKEMYSFVDQGDESLALRPEGTASVVRAHIDTGAYVSNPVARYYYSGPMFRRERPQKGRQRQFYQIGCELLGVDNPVADAEVIAMVTHFFEEVGVSGLTTEINSIGCSGCRPDFNAALIDHLNSCKSELCDDCLKRLDKNPMRILDCKYESCRKAVESAPSFPDYWCEECSDHFTKLCEALDLMEIKYTKNHKIVRGLDYYNRTAFEITTQNLGAQNAVAAGGRYDGLVKELGGPDIPGIGFALGVERLILLLQASGREGKSDDVIFFAAIGENARNAVLPIIQALRKDGIRVEWDYAAKSLKAQMRRADKLGAGSVVIVGDDEISKGMAVVRNMRSKEQSEVKLRDLPMHFV